jgi:P4 family phage/plasmid primase-like protien
LSAVGSLVWLGNVGHAGAREALDQLGEVFEEIKPSVEQGSKGSSWQGMISYVVSRIEVKEDRHCCGEWAFTESHMANRAAEEILVGTFRWSGGMNWVRWTGKIWLRVEDAELFQVIKEWLLDGFKRSNLAWAANPADKALEGVMKGWRSMLSQNAIAHILKLAQGVPGVIFDAADMDADPDLLNAQNGVVDLRTGELLEHDHERLMSKITPCAYVPGATHEDMIKVLSALPEDVRGWMQDRIGQSATGHMTPDDLLCILQGSGQNAKSTLLEGISTALGSYHTIVSDRVVMGDITRDEIMALQGARSVWLEETPEAAHLDIAKLKKIIGTSDITGHHLYKSSVTWKATHSLFITTNYVPMVSETDHGTWRRLALIRFPYTFTKDPVGEFERLSDPTLRLRVTRDVKIHEAFLAWIIEGAREFYMRDMVTMDWPTTVRRDTDDWRADVDLVMGYWRDRLTHDPTRFVLTTDLRADFNEWTERKGHKGLSEKVFNARFADHTETTRAHVRKERIRTNTPGISRPHESVPKAPVQAFVWAGVRFVDDEDPFK